MAQPWVLKYQPTTIKAFSAHQNQVLQMQQFVQTFKQQKKKALLLYGPTGVGKTAAVSALAAEMNYEFIEINGSDTRSKDAVLSLLGSVAKQRSLFSSGKIILVDEIDSLSRKDRGAVSAVEKIIAETSFPLFLTCHDLSNKKIKSLTKKVNAVAFPALSHSAIAGILEEICKKENLAYDIVALKTLARQVDGDIRAAINDLQSLSFHEKITMDVLGELGYRNKEESVHDALLKIFKVSDAAVAKDALNSVHEDFDQVMLWIDENLPKEYTKPEDLAQAYDYLSRADVFKGRIRRWQYWRFLLYVLTFMSSGVAVSKTQRNKMPVKYERSKRLLKLWLAKQRYAKRQAIAAKLSDGMHVSTRYAQQHIVPYLRPVFQKKTPFSEQIATAFELDADEVAWLSKA